MNMLCKRKRKFIKQMQQQANSSLHNTLAKIWGFQAIQRAILSSNYVNFSNLNRIIPFFCAASPFASDHFAKRTAPFYRFTATNPSNCSQIYGPPRPLPPPLLHVLLPLLAALWHHSSCGGEGGSGSIKYLRHPTRLGAWSPSVWLPGTKNYHQTPLQKWWLEDVVDMLLQFQVRTVCFGEGKRVCFCKWSKHPLVFYKNKPQYLWMLQDVCCIHMLEPTINWTIQSDLPIPQLEVA